LTISVDNATANDSAIEWLKKRNMVNNDALCCHKFIHVKMCTHTQPSVHEGLKDIDDSTLRIRNMVKYVKGSPQRLA
jgi:hypothetical protein